MDTKACSRCRETKTLDQFYRKEGRPSSWCKPCTLADIKARYRSKHPEPPPYQPPAEKACNKCGVTKPLEQFHRHRSARDGRNSFCAVCATAAASAWNKANPGYHRQKAKEYGLRHPDRKADNNLRWRLGLPWGTYAQMLEAQGGKCAICGTTKPGDRIKRFHTDHDEASGDVRGLLCNNCNNGIGRLNHDPIRLRLAADYLDRWILSKRTST